MRKLRRDPFDEKEKETKPFLAHLEDLRQMLVRCILTLVITMSISFPLAPQFLAWLKAPLDLIVTKHEKPVLAMSFSQRPGPALVALSISNTVDESLLNLNLDTNATKVLKQALEQPENFKLDLYLRSHTDQPLLTLQGGEHTNVLALTVNVSEDSKTLFKRLTDSRDRYLQTLYVTDAFMLALKLSFWFGLILGAPLLIYFIMQFVFPGLTHTERKVIRQSLGFAAILFFAGVALAYFVAVPIGTQVMYKINVWLGTEAQWTISSYISFATFTMLGFGLIFEFPIILVILGRIGLITSAMLRNSRKMVVIISLVVAMIISPSPDVISMLIMALPLYILFEISMVLIWLGERQKQALPKDEPKDETPTD
jgi:sec-independent protein translocase protein TatC